MLRTNSLLEPNVSQPDAGGGSDISVSGGIFTCRSGSNGGFLYAAGDTRVNIAGALVERNVAGKRGGAVGLTATLTPPWRHLSIFNCRHPISVSSLPGRPRLLFIVKDILYWYMCVLSSFCGLNKCDCLPGIVLKSNRVPRTTRYRYSTTSRIEARVASLGDA